MGIEDGSAVFGSFPLGAIHIIYANVWEAGSVYSLQEETKSTNSRQRGPQSSGCVHHDAARTPATTRTLSGDSHASRSGHISSHLYRRAFLVFRNQSRLPCPGHADGLARSSTGRRPGASPPDRHPTRIGLGRTARHRPVGLDRSSGSLITRLNPGYRHHYYDLCRGDPGGRGISDN